MTKRLKITPEIADRIAATYGAKVNAEDFIVFEALSLNTLPLRQPGSIFHGGVVGEATLTEMAALLQRGEGIPLITMHASGNLPVGKVFWGEVVRDSLGRPSLKTQFYVSKQEVELAQKVEEGVIDEVSVGFQANSLLCSKCGFDYMGTDADFSHVFAQTCENEHTIGRDGVHLKVVGLKAWHELSLVGKGAAQGAKILAQASEGTALAAGQAGGRAFIIQLSANQEQDMPDPVMVNLGELTGLATELAAAKAGLAKAEADRDAAQASATELSTKVTDLETQLAAAKATPAAVEPTAEEKAAAQADADAKAATLSFLKGQFDKLNVALGQKDVAAPASEKDLIVAIEAAQVKLASIIPTGGKAAGAATDAARAGSVPMTAFRSR